MLKTYKVAHHCFCAEVPEALAGKMSQYSPFEVEGGDPLFSLEVVEDLPHGPVEEVYDQPTEPGETKIALYHCDEGFVVHCRPTSERPLSCELLMADDYSWGKLKILRPQDDMFSLNNALMLLYAFRTATLDTLEMHASVIQNGGKAFLFLAKSGTGKSTHSSLWLKHIPGSRLLNDDNPIVRVMPDGKVWAFGSPWSGKTPCYKNEEYPVGAFVRIRRSQENSLTPLGVLESYALIYSSSSGFKADEAMADGLHHSIEGVVSRAKCFVLDCRPDEEAAQVCASGVR